MGCGDRSVLKPLLPASYRNKGRKRHNNNGGNNNDSDDETYSKDQYELSEINDKSSGKGPLKLVTMAFLRKLLLLVWKNLLFRKRHYILTALEIILPTILVIQIAWMKAQTPQQLVQAGKIQIQQGNQTFPVYNQTVSFM